MAKTMLPTDVTGLARLMLHGDLSIVAPTAQAMPASPKSSSRSANGRKKARS
jgi:hypothetical protein